MKGLDHMKDVEITIHYEIKLKWYQRCGKCLKDLFENMTPLKSDIKTITGSQNRSI